MKKKRILIVEDEPIIGLEIQETLENEGYDVCPVIEKADEVLKTYLDQKPDAIIMDIHLKGFSDGIDAVKRLRLINSDLPIIYITAYNTEATEKKALGTDPAAYIPKPFESSTLCEALEKCFPDSERRVYCTC